MRGLLVLTLLLGSASVSLSSPEVYDKTASTRTAERGKLCVIIRTYWGHSRGSEAGLRELLQSLQRQSHTNWEALVLVLDAKPFRDLAHILEEIADDRVWVYAEWVGAQFAPKGEDGYWFPDYHALLYDLTDEAVRACPKATRWVLITNGDNQYSSDAFQAIARAESADVVAFDFYSRYQRVTGPRCRRFAHAAGLPPCKVNSMRWCHTDLGANALNWPRLTSEDRRFGKLPSEALGSDNLDGMMAQSLVDAGWLVSHLSGSCLFAHDPCPQRCAQIGGAWDDSLATAFSSPGGRCIGQDAANALAREAEIEEIALELSHDGNLDSFQQAGATAATSIRCLMDRNSSAAVAHAWRFFGDVCASEHDLFTHRGA